MNVHPPKNGIYRYWSIAISRKCMKVYHVDQHHSTHFNPQDDKLQVAVRGPRLRNFSAGSLQLRSACGQRLDLGSHGIPNDIFPIDIDWLYMIIYDYIYIYSIISKHIQTLGMDDWVRIRWLLGDPISLLSRWTLFHHGDGGVECEEHRGIRSSWCQTGSWGWSTTGPAWGGGDVMPWDVDDIWGFRATHTNTQYQRTAPVHVKGKSQPGDGHILDQLVVIICHH